MKDNIVCRKGVKKGSFFSINPQLIKNAKVNLVTTLKTLEPHALKALIMEDLKLHPGSRISEIAQRLPEADIKDLRKIIYPLVNKEFVLTERNRKEDIGSLSGKKKKKKE